MSGPGSSVDIATELRAERSGIGVQLGTRFSAPVQTGPGAHPASCIMDTRSFPGAKRPGRVADPSNPHLVPMTMGTDSAPETSENLPTLMRLLITDFEIFAATVFYKILWGRQPRQVIQIHRRFGH